LNESDSKSSLGFQADEIITAETDWQEFASEFSPSTFENRDGYPEWHTSCPFEPMFLATLWAMVEEESYTGIPKRLSEQPKLAEAFGFDPDNLPSESTFKLSRLERRFDELWKTLELGARDIRQVAAERGAPIGSPLTCNSETESTDSEPSKRTIDRMLRQKGKQVLDEVKNVAIPSIDLPRPENPVYEKDELLVLEAIAAITRSAANGAGDRMGDVTNPNPELDDPFYEDGPSGETLLDAMKQMSVDEIADIMNFALRKIYTRAKPRLKDLEHDNGHRFGTRAKLALDITYVAYRGDREEMVWLQGAPENKEYRWCHKFATATIVGENTHYVVGVCPLGSTEYADTDAYTQRTQSYYVGDVVRRLLEIANQYVDIRVVYADREFHAADVINTLEAKNLNYVIPAVKNKRVKRKCERFDQLKRGFGEEEHDEELYVENEFAVNGIVKQEPGFTRVTTTLVLLPPDEDDETHEDGSPQPFLTNVDVSDEVALDRRWATKQIEEYSDRGAIERSYSSIKECAAWTTSKEFEVRWFHFAFGCIIYNLWLLVDFLTQERIGVIETRKKPRITLSRFLRWLDKVMVTLL
jgi:hypothetical protein